MLDPKEVDPIVERIRPLLAGKPPEIQGAVLADLLAMFLAGNHPDIREEILDLHIETVRRLIEPNENIIFARRPRPPGWPK